MSQFQNLFLAFDGIWNAPFIENRKVRGKPLILNSKASFYIPKRFDIFILTVTINIIPFFVYEDPIFYVIALNLTL